MKKKIHTCVESGFHNIIIFYFILFHFLINVENINQGHIYIYTYLLWYCVFHRGRTCIYPFFFILFYSILFLYEYTVCAGSFNTTMSYIYFLLGLFFTCVLYVCICMWLMCPLHASVQHQHAFRWIRHVNVHHH